MKNLAEKLGLGEGLTSTLVWIGTSVVLLLVVLVLAVWLVRMLRPSLNLGGSQSRGGRPQRLAITDAFSLDREGRKLVIVRRDNVEHLLLIGGPNDVLVEASIVRTERSGRDRPRSQGDADLIAAAETALAAELPRMESAATVEPPALPPVLPPAPQPMAPPPKPPASPPISKPHPAQPLDDEFENALAAMQAAQQRQQASARPTPPPPPAQPAPPLAADRFTLPPMPAPQPMPTHQPIIPAPPVEEFLPAPVVTPAPPPAPEPPALEPVTPKQPPMSEMARRLNEVLQKPLSGTLRPPFNKSIPPVPPMPAAPRPAEHKPIEPVVDLPPPAPAQPPVAPMPEPPPPPAPPAKAEPAPAPLPSKSTDIEMDLLEEEMARLLGRPQPPSGSGS